MHFSQIIYIFAIAFQLAAALMLVSNISTSKNGIIKAYCAQHTAIAFWEHDKSLADYSNLKATIKNAWINKFAFSYLCVGYLISIWGEPPSNRWLAFAFVLIIIAGLIFIPNKIAKYKSEHFGTVNLDDIPKVDGVQYHTI